MLNFRIKQLERNICDKFMSTKKTVLVACYIIQEALRNFLIVLRSLDEKCDK